MRNPVPIVKVCTDNPRLIITVNSATCPVQELLEPAKLTIWRELCNNKTKCVEAVNDCGVRYIRHEPIPSLTLTYPSIGFGSNGGIEFYLDDKFYRWGAGRYKATLHIPQTSITMDLRIELCTDAYYIAEIDVPDNDRGCT